MTISRLRAGLAITFAAVSLMAGAQAAQACTEPTLGDLPARGEEKQLVRFELTGLTPGSEYLVKVNGRERKSGVATTDKVSRRFRMPHLGDSNRRVKVEVVIANDTCETSPWKLEEKMTYRPAPAPEPPATQVEPTPTPTPAPAPDPSPSPPRRSLSAGQPRASRTPRRPRRRWIRRRSPSRRSPRRPRRRRPPRRRLLKEGRAWVTPPDPYQKGENTPPKLNDAALARTDRPSDVANSTAALIGLAGLFLLLAGTGAIGWTRFRRYDDQRLEEILNPEGKLPTHLDPKAKDMATEAAPQASRLASWPAARKSPKCSRADAGGRRGRGVLAHLSDEEKASMSEEELEALKPKYRKERKAARRAQAQGRATDLRPHRSRRCRRRSRGVAGAEAGRQGRAGRGGLEGQGEA